MKFEDFYSYENTLFASLQQPAAEISNALLWGNRVGDTLKETIRKKFKMPFTAAYFHSLAHKQLSYLDEFADILHTENLEQEYPATPSLAEEIEDIDKAFYVLTDTFRDTKKAFYEFIKVTDNADHKAMCVATEDLLKRYGDDFMRLLEAWNTWKGASSITSYESWLKKYIGDEENNV